MSTKKRVISKKNKRTQKHKKNKQTQKHKKNVTNKHNQNNNMLPVLVYGRIHSLGCGHCIDMNIYWNPKITTFYKNKHFDIESTEIDKKKIEFDSIYNPSSSFEVNGYPTIYKMYRKGGPILYFNSDRGNNGIGIINWLKEPEVNIPIEKTSELSALPVDHNNPIDNEIVIDSILLENKLSKNIVSEPMPNYSSQN